MKGDFSLNLVASLVFVTGVVGVLVGEQTLGGWSLVTGFLLYGYSLGNYNQ